MWLASDRELISLNHPVTASKPAPGDRERGRIGFGGGQAVGWPGCRRLGGPGGAEGTAVQGREGCKDMVERIFSEPYKLNHRSDGRPRPKDTACERLR